ncbi:MAG: hypothetical protein Q8L48_17250 [Archangium sp.]|nr:hypothetical protein [Archangium sp.]
MSLILVAAAQAQERRGAPASPAKVSRGLIVGNAISLGLLYLGNVGTAVVSALVASSQPGQTSSLNGLFIPIAGPFVALADPRNHTPLAVFALVFDAVAYLTSLTVLTVAIVVGSSKLAPTAWLSPGAAGAAGATLTLRLP